MTPSAPLTANERAELELLRDMQRRLVVFDGGPELLSHQQMHRHHKTEPYIGCAFCRDSFMRRTVTEEMLERALNAAFEAKGRELSYTEESWVRAAVNAAVGDREAPR